MCQPGKLASQAWTLASAADTQDLGFPLDRGVFETQVETPASQRIAKAPFFVRTKHDKRYRRGRYRPKFRYRDLPGTEDFEQQCLKLLVHFVEFIDEKHARAILVTQGTKHRPFREEIERMPSPADLAPVFFEMFSLGFNEQRLQCFVKFPNLLAFVDPTSSLKPLYLSIISSRAAT